VMKVMLLHDVQASVVTLTAFPCKSPHNFILRFAHSVERRL
jgi:hypothetical protein